MSNNPSLQDTSCEGSTTTAANSGCCLIRRVTNKGADYDGTYVLQNNQPTEKPDAECADTCVYTRQGHEGDDYCFREVDLADSATVSCDAPSSSTSALTPTSTAGSTSAPSTTASGTTSSSGTTTIGKKSHSSGLTILMSYNNSFQSVQ